MVISHKHRFIFIKTRKTAGTSIEVFLSQVCGDQDVLLPLRPPEAGHRPRNYDEDCFRNNSGGFRNHMPARQIKELVPAEVWNNYFKFCVERNPWDKCLSHYHFIKNRYNSARDLTLDDYCAVHHPQAQKSDQYMASDFENYTDTQGNWLVDRVLRYEKLDEELAQVFAQLGIPFGGTLKPRAKSDFRRDRRHYSQVLSAAQAQRIRQVFWREIGAFGYVY